MAGRVSAILARKASGRTRRVAIPGITEGQRRTGGAAVQVVEAAHLEVGPLGDVTGAADAAGVGAEEVRLSKGRGPRDAGEDDKPQEDKGNGDEEEGE